MSDGARIEVDGGDYFGQQKKKLNIADRRPVIRRASDLVGPGIGANAVRITNYNDLLATYDGFFSSDAGAANAPNDTDDFAGTVSSDAELGGVQVFTSLTSSLTYQRAFTRNPSDPATLYWGDWAYGGGLEGRTAALESLTASMNTRLTAAEAAITANNKPLITGLASFWLENGPAGYVLAGTVSFGMTFPGVPAFWAIKAGFVSGSSQILVALTDNVTTTGGRISLINAGPTITSFDALPIRWFAQMPN